MTLRNAALFALIGMAMLTFVTLLAFLRDLSGALRDIVPVLRVLESFVYLVASASLTVFFGLFRRTQ